MGWNRTGNVFILIGSKTTNWVETHLWRFYIICCYEEGKVFFICIAIGSNYQEGEGWNPIIRLNPTTFLCLSQVPSQVLDFRCHFLWFFNHHGFTTVDVCVNIGGIIDHCYLNFIFIFKGVGGGGLVLVCASIQIVHNRHLFENRISLGFMGGIIVVIVW